MKLFRASAQLALLLVLSMLSCAGDEAPRLGWAKQASNEETPPEQPKPFELPEDTIVPATGAASLPGSGQVTPDGAYTYRLPIDVPAGRGIQPSLAITYSSRAGNGPLGVGFSLSGLSSIQRCHKTIASDGVVDGIDNDETDVFCLDGQRLVNVRGAHGSDGAEYRTEEESFARVISYGSPKVDRFRVWLKDGRIRDYEPVGPLDFRMTKEQDRYGNAITYIYADFGGGGEDDPTEILPAKIEYLDHWIEFFYGTDDPDAKWRKDRATLYTAGVASNRHRLLQSIIVHAKAPSFDDLTWSYDLTYKWSDETLPPERCGTGRSQLVEVTRRGFGDASLTRKFTWTARHRNWFGEAHHEDHPWFMGAAHPLVLDVDDDGKDEVLFRTTDGARYVLLRSPSESTPLSSREVLASPSGFDGVDLRNAKAVDAGGDGRNELFAWNDRTDQFELYAWTGSTFESTGTTVPMSPDLGSIDAGVEPFHFADVDGDGLADMIKLLDNDVDGLYEPSFVIRRNLPSGDFDSAEETGIPVNAASALEFESIALDVQGDGRAGLWTKGAPHAYYPDDAGGFTSAEVPQDGWFPVRDSVMADLNGDGLRDALHFEVDPTSGGRDTGFTVAWNTGKGFSKPDLSYRGHINDWYTTAPPYPAALQVADLDDDGRDDIISVLNDIPYVIDGGGIFVYQLLVSPSALAHTGMTARTRTIRQRPGQISAVRHGDFNGDGLLDLMYFVAWCSGDIYAEVASGCGSGRMESSVRVHLQQSTVVDVVQAVQDEGGTTLEEITYARAWTDAPERPSCVYPQVCRRRGLPVVREQVVHEAAGISRRLQFSYDDPRSDLLGRGFLGFGKFRVWEPQVPRETVTTFDHGTRVGTRYPFAHRPETVTVVTPILESAAKGPTERPGKALARVSRRTMRYEPRELNGGLTQAVFPRDWTSREWEEEVAIDWTPERGVHITEVDGPVQAPLRARFGATRFDDWGGLELETSETVGGVRTQVETGYEHRLEPWLLSLPAWQKVTSTTPGGAVSTVRRTSFDHNDAGRIERVEVEPVDPAAPRLDVNASVRYDYDTEGLLRKVTQTAPGVPARRLHIAYDGTPGHTAPSVIWDDLGHAQWFAVDTSFGVVVAEMDANGVQTTRVHDAFGRLVRRSADGAGEQTLSYERRWDGLTVRTSDGIGASAVVELDLSGRPWRTSHVGHDGSTLTVETVYDALGRVIRRSRPARRIQEAQWSRHVYDSLGRLLRTVGPDGATTRYKHSFFETEAWDPRGSHTKLVRDLDGRVVQSSSYLGATELSTAEDHFLYHHAEELTTHYEYGPFDQVERIIDPRSNVTEIEYDVRGRRTRLVDPDQGTTRFHRNGLGDLWRKVEGGDETIYERDAIGRPYRVTDADGTTEYVWDTAAHGMGRLAATTSPDGTTTDYGYDEHGRLEHLGWTVGGQPFKLRAGYDPHGRIETMSYPEIPGAPRFTVKHTYDSRGYLERIADVTAGPASDGSPLWTVNARNDDGALVRATYGNGVEMERSYHPVTAHLETVEQRLGGSVLSALRYEYYPDGRVKHRTEVAGDRGESYVYDTLHRLRAWSLNAGDVKQTTEYRYDALGNLTRVLVGGEEQERNDYLDPRPHAASSNLDGSFFYDARGRLEQDPDRSLAYTSFDLPREIATAAGVTRFEYDAAGARVRKQGPAGTTVTIGGLYQRREDADGTKHVYLVPGSDGLAVAQVVVDEASGERWVQYLHHDALGSVTLVTDADGSADASDHAYYEPFGRRIARDGAPFGGPTGDVRLGLTGHEHDDELGLVNMKGRIYDPKLKRVLTPDPLVSSPLFGQSYNRYSYVLNDPLNLTDPTGFEPDCTTCGPWQPRQPPWEEGDGGGVTIISDGGGGADGTWGDHPSFSELPPPRPLVRSDVDGFQSAAAAPYHGGFLGKLVHDRQRDERLRHEADQRSAFRGAVVGAGAVLVIWSGGYALLAIEELSVFGSAIGMTSTQLAAAGAASFTTRAVPALLGELWVLEGLRDNDPGRVADGLMMAMSAGATYGPGLGSGPRGGGGAEVRLVNPRALRVTEELSSKSQAVKMSKLMGGRNGFGPFEPIDAIESEGALYIVDGHHRTSAAIRAKLREVPVRIRPASSDEETKQLFRSWTSTLSDRGF
ncbi:RHS repeat-associated core domain-containing protein [Sorangium sp. So ce131]|uniref:RHS repeat-associated core domain-containing protein n=1 Tax=Sorangium sp. So ce131 TaxID=3133282 RepID=UPI003F5D6977